MCITSGPRAPWFAANPQPLWAPPGAVYDYSNIGFALASLVVTGAAGVADTDYEELVRESVFGPAGMLTATYNAAAADHAAGHQLDSNNKVTKLEEPIGYDCPLLHPPAGILATASDYGHFIEAMLAKDGRLLSASSIAAMESPYVSMRWQCSQAYGYGLIVEDCPYPGHPALFHTGVVHGFTSQLFMVPDYLFGVVAMTNGDGDRPVSRNISFAAFRRFISDGEHWGSPNKTPSSSWGPYAGSYEDTYGQLGTDITISIVSNGGTAQLMFSAPNAKPTPISGPMKQAWGDEWSLPDGTDATFFPGVDNTPAVYLVSRKGVATRK